MSRRTLSLNPSPGSRNSARPRRSFVPSQVGRAALEARLVLSTATLSPAGVLTVTGTSGADTIGVTQYQGYVFTDSSVFTASSVKSIVVDGLDGNDAIRVSTTLPITLNGGAGANTYTAPDNATIVDPILTGGRAMSKAVMDKYQAFGGPAGVLGAPVADEVAAYGGRVARFQGGEIDYSASTGAHEVQGLIYWESVTTAGEVDTFGVPVRNILGLATTDELASGTIGRVSHFQGGDVDWSTATGAHVVYGAILGEYNATAGEVDALGHSVKGILGLPTSDESAYADGRVTHFQGGDVFSSANAGTHVVYGAILGEYNATAGEVDAFGHSVRGILGMPTSDEAPYADGRVTHFQGGDIYSSAATGTHVLYGSIGQTWRNYGAQTAHLLGLPTADEAPGPNGSRVVAFRGGSLYTSGPRIVIGANHSEAIAALDASQTDGTLDSTEVAFFQGIASPSNAFTDPATANLMYKLINRDAANATYQGTAVGNLAANSPAWKVNDLERKWFEGQDHPVDSYNLTDSKGVVTKVNGGAYSSVSGPLFGPGGPVYTDVSQGNLGDCFFLAALAETDYRNPQAIRNMFTDNGDGTFTVRFLSNSPDYVTVDRMLPSKGTSFATADSREIWVALAEKAYAQANQEGWFYSATPGNTYQSMEGGYALDPLSVINGGKFSNAAPTIDSAWASGREIELSTGKTPPNSSIVPTHAYAVVGYDATTKVYTLFNPFGVNGGTATDNNYYPGYVYETQAQIIRDFNGATWSSTAPDRLGLASARPATHATATIPDPSIPVANLVPLPEADATDATGPVVAIRSGGVHPRFARAPRPWTTGTDA